MVTSPASNSHQPGLDSHQAGQDGRQWLESIPGHIRARLPAASAKPRREVLRALILELCAMRALSARELAAALNRTEHKPLVRDYLSPMVGDGMLADPLPPLRRRLAAAGVGEHGQRGVDPVNVRISAIVDARFSLIVDGETASSRMCRGGAQAPGLNVP